MEKLAKIYFCPKLKLSENDTQKTVELETDFGTHFHPVNGHFFIYNFFLDYIF